MLDAWWLSFSRGKGVKVTITLVTITRSFKCYLAISTRGGCLIAGSALRNEMVIHHLATCARTVSLWHDNQINETKAANKMISIQMLREKKCREEEIFCQQTAEGSLCLARNSTFRFRFAIPRTQQEQRGTKAATKGSPYQRAAARQTKLHHECLREWMRVTNRMIAYEECNRRPKKSVYDALKSAMAKGLDLPLHEAPTRENPTNE